MPSSAKIHPLGDKTARALADDTTEIADTNDLFDKEWTQLRFFFSWLACIVTPVTIGIVQAFDFANLVIQIGIVCDVFFLLEVNRCYFLISAYQFVKKKLFVTLNMTSPRPSSYSSGGKRFLNKLRIFSLFQAIIPLLVPIIAEVLGGSDLMQAWLTIFRLVRLRDLFVVYNALKYKYTDLVILRNDTISRCFFTAVLTTIYATALASVWFYISCLRRNECTAADSSGSWVSADEVLREQDSFSIFIRSIHFIIQTLFTVGYGELTFV